MGTIQAAIEGAAAYLAEHPEAAAYTDSPATARLETGLRVVTKGPGGESVATDMVAAVGGGGTAPSPGLAHENLEALVRWAVDHCPVTDAMRRAVPLSVELA